MSDQHRRESEELRTKITTVSHELGELKNTNVNARASLDRQYSQMSQDKLDMNSLRIANERHFAQHTQDESEIDSLRSQLFNAQSAKQHPSRIRLNLSVLRPSFHRLS